jgi:4-aminobutyrate aminotransferase-like enzyme
VLDAIQRGGLQAHAAAVGAVLSAGFRRLHARFPELIGSVRGVGLMQGLEILRPGFDPLNPMSLREPWPEAASAISYAMRARRILLSVDGMGSNVIKIKPPM